MSFFSPSSSYFFYESKTGGVLTPLIIMRGTVFIYEISLSPEVVIVTFFTCVFSFSEEVSVTFLNCISPSEVVSVMFLAPFLD